MIQKLHVSKNLFDLASWITANGSTYTKDGESYTFASKQSMFATVFYFSETNIDVSISGTLTSGTITNPRIDLIKANGTTALSNALTESTSKSENVNCAGLRLNWSSTGGTLTITNLMLNTGSEALPYEPYGDTWNTKSYTKIVDTTQQVTSFPVVVRPMENTIPSWTIKGNLAQDGTPSPSNIIYPSETGERTGNLLFAPDTGTTVSALAVSYATNSSEFILNKNVTENNVSSAVNCNIALDAGTYSITVQGLNSVGVNLDRIYLVDSNNTIIVQNIVNNTSVQFTLTEATTIAKTAFVAAASSTYSNKTVTIMLNEGSTALPYEPYGYKLDIKSGSTTTPVYLGEVQTTRKIKKLVLTGEENFTTSSTYEKENTMVYYTQIADSYNGDNDVIYITSSHYQGVSRNTLYDSDSEMVGMTGSTALTFRVSKTYASNKNLFLSYLAQQYAAGTPVTVWYVLANETTTTLNEPLRKIGTYSDSVSGTNLSVTAQSPTTIDVDTSLKPSEMDLTYTGTKMCKRKKRVNGAWV